MQSVFVLDVYKHVPRLCRYVLMFGMAQRGKNNDPNYTSLGVRIPKELKRRLTVKLAYYDDLNASMALERLIELWVTGQIEIGTPVDTPQDAQVFTNMQTQKTPPKTQDTPPRDTNIPELASASTPRFTEATELGKLRAELGMSQRKLASALGIHHSTVGDYERGQKDTPPEVLEAARALLSDSFDGE